MLAGRRATKRPIAQKGFEMRKLLDANDPFFIPVWRRWAVTLFPLAWSGVELWHQQPLWAVVFGAAGAYAGYELLFKGPQDK